MRRYRVAAGFLALAVVLAGFGVWYTLGMRPPASKAAPLTEAEVLRRLSSSSASDALDYFIWGVNNGSTKVKTAIMRPGNPNPYLVFGWHVKRIDILGVTEVPSVGFRGQLDRVHVKTFEVRFRYYGGSYDRDGRLHIYRDGHRYSKLIMLGRKTIHDRWRIYGWGSQ